MGAWDQVLQASRRQAGDNYHRPVNLQDPPGEKECSLICHPGKWLH